jgi:acyl-coenzyme A synthetase/AMP-(fatty) acid ligase
MMVRDGNLGPGKWSKLRSVMFAGEVFPIKYLRKLMILIPHAEYHNLYGPTETNVITHYQVPRVPAEQADAIPIGKACANTEVFALNPEGERITRPGQIGELFARGSCVAQGYWGDLEKTDRSFVLNGTQANFRERMFKSGDLVTLDEEDNYIFLGRQDHMVKSRGFRIELAEIETALYHHPEIKEAAVVAIPDEMVGNRLKAFVVMDSNSQCGSIELKNFCSKRIPKYMIPETIDFLETLPKTSTGKIDRPQLMTQT